MGHGAYGVVVSALDHSIKAKVAIKKVPKAFEDLIDAKRIVREIKLLKFCIEIHFVSKTKKHGVFDGFCNNEMTFKFIYLMPYYFHHNCKQLSYFVFLHKGRKLVQVNNILNMAIII